MDQAELRQWEHRCVQEEVPRCIAACPLHVDARTFCSLMGQKRWDKAWQVLAKTLPLPGVTARLCDGPCKSACVRKDAGGSVEIERLEMFCASIANPVAPPRPLPSRKKKIAVFGGGTTGLCAAWELSRRGFTVTLYCDTAGAKLRDLSEDILPGGVLDRELESLGKLGVVLEQGAELTPAALDARLEECDAVFLDSDTLPPEMLDFNEPDPVTLETGRPGVFACRAGETSVILQAAAARRAANSVERFTQGVSMVAGRDLEGPYETRLFTSLDKVEPVPPVCTDDGCSEEQVRDEARRCIQCECLECVKVCEYLKHYKHYPKVYVRRIYNNESIVMGTRQANKMINSCMLCGLCETVCPEDFSMADVCLEARRTLVRTGNMPPSAHEFALRDMAFADGDKCALARHAPGTEASEYVFFPGCQMTASDPGAVEAAYEDLLKRMGAVGLMLRCCGAPALWSGREELEKEAAEALKTAWEELGGPKIIAACPSCMETLRGVLPGAEIISYWSVLRTLGAPESARGSDVPLALNDPCAARHDKPLRDDVRALIASLEVSTTEPELNGESAQCCGYGGLLSEVDPDLAGKAALRRTEGVDEDMVTYCAMCRDMVVKNGKRALHVFDLLFPGEGDRASRPAPGYSARRENRARLKETLLKKLWSEEGAGTTEPFEAVRIVFTDQAAENMEQRRILKSDVQKVLLQAEQSGRYLKHETTGHRLASFRPVVVTYWVEYEVGDTGFTVHNAWSHRMKIKGGQA